MISEFIGAPVLVVMGCDAASGSGYILTALAFGLVIAGMACCVGNISGCRYLQGAGKEVIVQIRDRTPEGVRFFAKNNPPGGLQ